MGILSQHLSQAQLFCSWLILSQSYSTMARAREFDVFYWFFPLYGNWHPQQGVLVFSLENPNITLTKPLHDFIFVDNTVCFCFLFLEDNGLCPIWFETLEFDIICPPLAKIRFVVHDEDMFGDPNFVAQACFPVTSLRQGSIKIIL